MVWHDSEPKDTARENALASKLIWRRRYEAGCVERGAMSRCDTGRGAGCQACGAGGTEGWAFLFFCLFLDKGWNLELTVAAPPHDAAPRHRRTHSGRWVRPPAWRTGRPEDVDRAQHRIAITNQHLIISMGTKQMPSHGARGVA